MSNDGVHAARMAMGQYGDDLVLVTFNHGTYASLWYSTDHAASFTEHTLGAELYTGKDTAIFVPYTPDNALIILVNGSRDAGDGSPRVLVSTGGPAVGFGDKSPSEGFEAGEKAAFFSPECVTDSPSDDGSNIFFVLTNVNASHSGDLSKTGILRLKTWGGGYSEWFVLQDIRTGLRWQGYGFGGWPWDSLKMQMAYTGIFPAGIQRSEDGGATWQDASGNLASVCPAASGVSYIVPVWLAY
jgi:hypothetical protein